MLCLLWLIGTAAHAYDFEAGGLYYYIVSKSAKTVIVTYPNSAVPSTSNANEYNAAVVEIPSQVSYEDETYTVTRIGNAAFAYCTELTSVSIPESVTDIGEHAFRACTKLTSITIPNNVKTISKYAFCESGLANVTLSDGLEQIGEYAFRACESLTSVVIPNSVTTMSNGAFYSCGLLASVTIGSGIKTIGSSTFYYCPKLTDVICLAETAPTLNGTNIFLADYFTLYVPNSCIETYADWATYYKTIKEYVVIDDETNFPDENFRKYLLAEIDTDNDGLLTKELETDTIDVWNGGIKTLKGIEYFTALTSLNCETNELTTLDVSKNTALKTLMCSVNELTELDVTNNTALMTLSCYENQLTTLDLSANTALTTLNCSNNKLTTLDLSANTALKTLDCSNNQIAGADMDALIESLPQTTDGELKVYDANSQSEGNVMTKVQVTAAKAKGWTPQYLLKNYTWSPYDGSTPESITVTVGESGFATFCSEYNVDFSSATTIAAYKASVSGNTVTLTRVYTVAAEEGVLLKVLDDEYKGKAVELPTIETAEANEGNAFVGTLTDIVFEGNQTEDGETIYVLAKSDSKDKVGFFTNDNASRIEVGAHKAYLPVVRDDSADETRGLTLVFGDDTTSIVEIAPKASAADDAFYTLGGVRVKTPRRGLYIKNGKKVFIK